MTSTTSGPVDLARLHELADELLEAQLDTLQLLIREESREGEWDAHAEYLRALTRTGRAILTAR